MQFGGLTHNRCPGLQTRGVPPKSSDYAGGVFSCVSLLTLTLFVAWVFADHHDAAVAADDLALVADLLNAWLYLHNVSLFAVLVHSDA